jgi:hypothetical protein
MSAKMTAHRVASLSSHAELRRAFERLSELMGVPAGLSPQRLVDEVKARYDAQTCIAIETGARLVQLFEQAQEMKASLESVPFDQSRMLRAMAVFVKIGETMLTPSAMLNVYRVHAARIEVCDATEAFAAHCATDPCSVAMPYADFQQRGKALAAYLQLAVGKLQLERMRPTPVATDAGS